MEYSEFNILVLLHSITLVNSHDAMLQGSFDGEHLFLVPDLNGKAFE